jgi:peptidyl-tRNA hydrolase, PTH1 family
MINHLIVGLGNPGSAYEDTRHNIGFRVVGAYAEKYQLVVRSVATVTGELARGQVHGKKAILLWPMTYMNSSGRAVRMCADYFEVPSKQILVVCDDVALPFGTLRMRENGSSGGHNGLKSIEAYLGTTDYPRLKVGIGDRQQGELADYVLGKFLKEEQMALPKIVEDAIAMIDRWLGTTI